MKGLPKLTARQEQPTSPGNAVTSPAISSKRTGTYLPGAFLLLALVASVSYGAATQQSTTKANAQSAASTTKLQTESNLNLSNNANQPTTPNITNQKESTMQSNQSSEESVSTQVVNNNGATTVTVNGETIVDPSDGAVSKTITTDNGSTVQINVSQDNASASNSSISSWSFSSGSTRINNSN